MCSENSRVLLLGGMAYIGEKIGIVGSEMDPRVWLGLSVGQIMCSV